MPSLKKLKASKWHELAEFKESVAVVVCSVKNIEELSLKLEAGAFVTVAHYIFTMCDRILTTFNRMKGNTLTKIDMYNGRVVVSCGLTDHSRVHVLQAYSYAVQVVTSLNDLPVSQLIDDDDYQDLVIHMCGGIAVGPVISGIVGSFPQFTIMGRTVSTAISLNDMAQPGTVLSFNENRPCDGYDGILDQSPDIQPLHNVDAVPTSPPAFTQETVSFNKIGENVLNVNGAPLTAFVLAPGRPRMIIIRHEPKLSRKLSSQITTSCGTEISSMSIDRSMVTNIRDSTTLRLSVVKCISDELNFLSDESHSDDGIKGSAHSIYSKTFYASRSVYLIQPIIIAHYIITLSLILFVLQNMSRKELMFTLMLSLVRALGNVIVPTLFQKYINTPKSLNVGVVVTLLQLTFCQIQVAASGSIVDPETPEFRMSCGVLMMGIMMHVSYTVFRLPMPLCMAISISYSIVDVALMALMFYRSWLLIVRFSISLIIGIFFVMLAAMLNKLDYEVYRHNYTRALTCKNVTYLLNKLMPPRAVSMLCYQLGDEDCNCSIGCADFVHAASSNKWTAGYNPSTVSPLVAAANSNAQSTARWQMCQNVVVCNLTLEGLDNGSISLSDDEGSRSFFAVVRDMHSMIDRIVEENGLWKTYVLGNQVIAVAGLSHTSSSSNAVECALDCAQQCILAISELNIRGSDLNSPRSIGCKLTAKIGVAAGPAITAVLGECHPAFLIWGPATSMAAAAMKASRPNGVLVHPSIKKVKATLSRRFEFTESVPLEYEGKLVNSQHLETA